jgi:hypothetical protein
MISAVNGIVVVGWTGMRGAENALIKGVMGLLGLGTRRQPLARQADSTQRPYNVNEAIFNDELAFIFERACDPLTDECDQVFKVHSAVAERGVILGVTQEDATR